MSADFDDADPEVGTSSPRRRAISLIREWIQAGKFASGQSLPAERALAKTGVSTASRGSLPAA